MLGEEIKYVFLRVFGGEDAPEVGLEDDDEDEEGGDEDDDEDEDETEDEEDNGDENLKS